jgi:hypothetical protein
MAFGAGSFIFEERRIKLPMRSRAGGTGKLHIHSDFFFQRPFDPPPFSIYGKFSSRVHVFLRINFKKNLRSMTDHPSSYCFSSPALGSPALGTSLSEAKHVAASVPHHCATRKMCLKSDMVFSRGVGTTMEE